MSCARARAHECACACVRVRARARVRLSPPALPCACENGRVNLWLRATACARARACACAQWACEDCGVKENLWLNLSDGYIGSGRPQVASYHCVNMNIIQISTFLKLWS